MRFSDLGLTPETLRAIEDVGYDTPTPIQQQAIPYVLMCRDVLGIAQTGTGKTAGFTLPMIDILAQGRAKARMPRSLIIAPTRELAAQIAENFKLYGKYHKLSMALLIGGESFKEQEAHLDKGVDVLIATPGRLIDLFERGRILLTDVKILVIDEADRMLDMGFIPDVERIVSLLPKIRQTLFFSATMDKQIRKLADAFLMNPKEIRVDPQTSTAATVRQALAVVDQEDKRRALREWLEKEDVRNAFIFCNRKRDVGVLYRSLTRHGFDAVQLHGDMPQAERTVTLERFRKGEARLMVCSDVAARGIDISDVSHVFNFDVPSHSEDYIHRIGRTGRAGKEGHAYTLATPADAKYVDAIEKLIGKSIPRVDFDSVDTRDLSGSDDRRGRKRGRGGRGRERDRGDRRDHREQAAPADAAETPAEQTPVPAAASAAADEGNGRDRAEETSRTEGRAAGRNRGGKGRSGRSRDGHPAWEVEEMQHGTDVAAFGGHTPAFMLVDPEAESARLREERERREAEADSRRAAAEARKADREAQREAEAARAAEPQAAEAEAGAAAPEASKPAEPKKRRRTRRPRKDEEPAPQPPAEAVEAAVAATEAVLRPDTAALPEREPPVEPAGEPVSMTPAPGEAPTPESAAQAEPAAESAAEAEAAAAEEALDEAPAKPKRTRKPAAKKATAAKKPAAKKTTTRTRKKAVEAEAPDEGAAAGAEAPEAAADADADTGADADSKPKRTRKAPAKKAAPKKTAAGTTAAGKTATVRKRTTRKKTDEAASDEPPPATD